MFGDTADPDTRAFVDAQKTLSPLNAAGIAQAEVFKTRQAELQKTISPPYTVAGKILSPVEKQIQAMVLARDWPALFSFLPPVFWGQYGILGKYSFTDSTNGGDASQRTFIPFSKADIRRFVFSPYYTVQPGHVCTDEQREMGVEALYKAGKTHKAKFPATDWRHIWPIYPGWGYPGQRFGCEKYVPSTWVKIRTPVVIAAAVVAAVYLGPLVSDKIAAIGTGGESSAGIVGAGTKTGIVSATQAAETATVFNKVQAGTKTLLSYVNKARTVEAISKGELPPPPISIVGSSFTDWAVTVAKKELADAAQEKAAELGMEYVQREMTKKEEAKLRAEIQAMQNELAKLLPANISESPNAQVPAEVQRVMLNQKKNAETINAGLAIGIPIALAYFLIG